MGCVFVGGDITGNLKVHVVRAHYLPDTDPAWNDPDPYVKVVAYKSDGTPVTMNTKIVNGETEPVFNQDLKFGQGTWTKLTIQAWDADAKYDDPMTDLKEYNVVPDLRGFTFWTSDVGPFGYDPFIYFYYDTY